MAQIFGNGSNRSACRRSSRSRSYRASLSCSLIALCVAGAAHAQDGAAEAGPQDEGAADIVVTGSRIVRPGLESANPIVALSAATIEQSGDTSLTDFLIDTPALRNSTVSDRSFNQSVTNINALNLRSLGTNRTLVLVNGRRHVAGEQGTAAVDVDSIPTDLVERIDVLTGGASAIYGADGVSGVVNFVLKRDFEGLSARGQAGISSRGDAGQRFGALTYGTNFADDRGNVTVAYEYNQRDRLLGRKRRLSTIKFVQNQDDLDDDPNLPDQVPLRDLRYQDIARSGAVDVDGDGIPEFLGNGAVYDRGLQLISAGGLVQGGSNIGYAESDIGTDYQQPASKHLVNVLANFEVSPALKLFAEGKFANNRASSSFYPQYDYGVFVAADNPFIPANIRDVAPDGVFVNRGSYDLGVQGTEDRRRTIRGVIGAEGRISDNATYEVSYNYGRTKIRTTGLNDRYTDRFYAALDAVTGPDGRPVCRSTLDPTAINPYGNYDGSIPLSFTAGAGSICAPLNIFGENVASPESVAFITASPISRSTITQQVVSGSVTGDFGQFFELPGGAMPFSIGAEWRKEKSRFTPDPRITANQLSNGIFSAQSGSIEVKEIFAELRAPLLKEVPGAHALEVGAALRLSDYDTIGGTTTWKADGLYAPIRDVTFRGTYSVAVRAPNISELFGAPSTVEVFFTDPCDITTINDGTGTRPQNCAALLSQYNVDPATFNPASNASAVYTSGISSGNADLREEKARTWTAGFVVQPSFIPRLSISFDWYDIKLSNAVAFTDGQENADLCVDQPTLDNPFCALVDRDPTSAYINGFVVRPVNVASFAVAGADLTVNYQLDLRKAGRLNLRFLGGYLDKQNYTRTSGAGIEVGRGTIPNPKYVANLDATWVKDGWSVNYGLSWQSKTFRDPEQVRVSQPDNVAPEYRKIKQRWEHDIQISKAIDDRFEIYGGVNNFTDQKSDQSLDLSYPVSVVGRFMYVGAKFRIGG